MPVKQPKTHLCKHYEDAIYYRDLNLVDDVLGKRGFMDIATRQITGRDMTRAEIDLIEAVMVAIMEHGFTPSAIAARSIYMSSPENLQAGVAAGLLGVASQFVGTMENCADLLAAIVAVPAAGREAEARRIVEGSRQARRPLPGFGHHLHRPDDPRAARLLELQRERGLAGEAAAALALLSKVIDETYGRHMTINATGAAAAIFSDLGIPVTVMRGFAIISRAAGLVAHLAEEQKEPSGRYIWDLVDHDIPFAGEVDR